MALTVAVCSVVLSVGLMAERTAHKWVELMAVTKADLTGDSLAVATVFPLVCLSAARKAIPAAVDLVSSWDDRSVK
jgi:hypothetical protein